MVPEVDIDSYHYFYDNGVSSELDLLALEPELYTLCPDTLGILDTNTSSANIRRSASHRTYTEGDTEHMRRCLGWIPDDVMQHTLDHTTILAKNHIIRQGRSERKN